MKDKPKNSIIFDMLPKELKIIKSSQYSYDTGETELALPPQKAPYATIIKRFQIDYSNEQKYKLGIMSMEEYVAWQIQLQQMEQEGENAPKQNHTFWEQDEVERLNISNEAYDDFLAQNKIDVSNNAMVDIDAIINSTVEASSNEAEAVEEAVSAALAEEEVDTSALPGGDDPNRVLTPEEIQALFAAMGVD